MKKRLHGFLTLLLVLVVQISFAQQKTVSGTVVDEDGLPVPGVTVMVQGTGEGTQTDFDGNYSISVNQGQRLVFSFVGFVSQEIPVGTSSVLDVTMQTDVGKLEEVVVLGYSTKGVEEVTGSSVTIGGDEVAQIPVPSVEQALQGKVAGVQISMSSGTPGSTQDVRIRGLSSLALNNEPLYVIDGVPVVNNNNSGSANLSSLNPLATINSQDIESITVLKDASATAAYGARGSNGVIVITTKSGSSGETKFSFNSTVGFQNDAYNEREYLTGQQRYDLLIESLVNSYGANGVNGDFGFTDGNALQLGVDFGILDPDVLDFDPAVDGYNWDQNIKNEDALTQNYTFSATGGDEKSNFYASLGYNKTEATVKSVDFERLNGSFSFERELRDNLDLSTSINVSNIRQNPILEQGSFFSNPFITRTLMSPFNSRFNDDGTENIDLKFGSLPNIFYVLENNFNRNMLTRAISNTKLDWELFDGLTFSNRISLDYQLTEYKSFINRYEGDAEDLNGYAESSDEKNFNWVYQGSLNYVFTLGKDHNFDATALFEYQNNQNSYLYGYGENFPTDGLINIASASANFDAFSSFSDWINSSYLALLNYNYAGKYVLDLTYRREGSSRFAPGNRYGDFGSVGAAWNIHREEFMNNDIFNTLRLRGSYGITGNNSVDINAYQALLAFGGDYNANGAATPSQFGNPDLEWEKGKTYDVGVNFGMFDSRLTGSFAYYNRTTSDLLQNVPLSLTTGFSGQDRNVGEMENSGIEAQLTYEVIRTQDFLWSVNGNYATVDNEVTELALGADGEPLDPLAGSSYKTTREGLPAAAWFMRTYAGVDTQTGLPTWYVNGVDGEVTSNYNAAERVYQGASALPTYSGGFGTRVQYKGFFAEANAYFAGGHKIYEQYAQFYLRTNSFTLGTYNGAQELLDRWQQPGDVTDVPQLAFGGSNNFHTTNSRHLFDGDYIRLKNVALGYSLPSTWAQSVGIDGLSLTLRGTNIATWVKDDGLKLDPEVRANGYTTLTTPPVESYTLSVNVNF
ncbi:SusC/RagA family TonB-linked outer membrane protein [Christiangramia sediminis]|uniref:TonB-dependent receptor n=1 Tax=Christiangramia sediminis TaxID=2881336 RepID=A0A9X1RY09_9FLAO|nr:TonB-dependent receptor [Christiangramia sediminis]MCB7481477.1 TonB-dependent receptor [Christiangramia sediminis]